MLLCEGAGCSVAVHQQCYGVAKIPKSKWLCDACKDKLSPSAANCACCPVVGGALRKVGGRAAPEAEWGGGKGMKGSPSRFADPDSRSMRPGTAAGMRWEGLCSCSDRLSWKTESAEQGRAGEAAKVEPVPGGFPPKAMQVPRRLTHSVSKNRSRGPPRSQVVSLGRVVPAATSKSGKAYVHVACALWTPEMTLAEPEAMRGVQLDHMTAVRAGLQCGLCKQAGGAVV
jgi:hypothetical protein